MTDNIVTLGATTTLPLPVERVLTADTALALREVVVLGWKEDGTMHLAMSHAGLDRALMLIMCAQKRILEQVET